MSGHWPLSTLTVSTADVPTVFTDVATRACLLTQRATVDCLKDLVSRTLTLFRVIGSCKNPFNDPATAKLCFPFLSLQTRMEWANITWQIMLFCVHGLVFLSRDARLECPGCLQSWACESSIFQCKSDSANCLRHDKLKLIKVFQRDVSKSLLHLGRLDVGYFAHEAAK